MKNLRLLLIISLSIIGLKLFAQIIPDDNFREKINNALGQPANYEPTVADLSSLTGTLDAEDAEIYSIEGAQYLTNLTGLKFYHNQITNISPLSNLTNLTVLELQVNSIGDISPLSDLTNLTVLELHVNSIGDISPLSDLTNLTYLSLYWNQISDISPLSDLTNLTYLSLISNQISDISSLSGLMNLYELKLENNQISDISPLFGLTNLNELRLNNNQISDISPLSSLTNLCHLRLGYNQISDISALSSITNLWDVRLESNQISDISALSDLQNLYRLYLGGNQITDIAPLVENTHFDDGDLMIQNFFTPELSNPLSLEAIETHIPILESRDFYRCTYPDEANLSAACYPSPIRHAENVSYNIELSWQGAESGTTYEVYLGTSNTELVSIGLGEYLGNNTFEAYPELLPYTEYWWKIKSTNQNEELWSGLWHFYTGDETGFDADFIVSNTIVLINEEIQFTDLSVGNPTSWEWDFQIDGVIDSNEQSPVFTYTEEGIYSVSLIVSDGINYNTETKIDYILVNPPIGVNPDIFCDKVLMSNFPNPFNPTTTIKFNVKEGETANLQIFSIKGQIVKSYPVFSVGNHLTEWNGEDNEGDRVSSGVYFYKLKSESTTKVRKMLMLK